MKAASLRLTLLISLLLQSCTVMHLHTNDKLTAPSSQNPQKGVLFYHVSLSGQPYFGTLTSAYTPEMIGKMKARYCSLSQKYFDQKNISAKHTENIKDARLLIDIQVTPYCSALPQEWLTGLSFGLIPSWGTRYDECTYTFEKTQKKNAHSYQIDSTSYNHLILFPVFWVNVFTANESNTYIESLDNYLTKE